MARAGKKHSGAAESSRRSSLEKMLDILDLFEEERLRWTPEQMMARLGCTRSTLYRYLRVLSNVGLVTALPDIGYTLGPRIAELDYEMRSSDPLITNGRPLLLALVKEIAGVGLLCRFYRDRVLCVHQEASSDAIRSAYDRGRAMPVARGAASRMILAHLKTVRLSLLYSSQSREFSQVGLGDTLEQVQANLLRIRKQGYCLSRGEVTPGVVGIAAPVFDSEREIIGSLSITVADAGINERRRRFLIDRIVFSAEVLTNAMRRTGTG
ncbi:MAG: IclR family transcriptional regulator [Betaproteobacteria bacterium RIFCSPLOWO2_12_FULL_63_13]|nr:MAG: IclR family transcriptional regulator [Betaproteobacteria bacterium RIFCSPLOWO2_02_FULL_63_19]OGA52593.1 MAG: IclR family transcriptional regulator [Betaproteobacteria bacterium RIFCSPLOWO2_12_FULL_63_13]